MGTRARGGGLGEGGFPGLPRTVEEDDRGVLQGPKDMVVNISPKHGVIFTSPW